MTKGIVLGVGINDYPGKVRFGNKYLPAYSAWKGMLARCYSTKELLKHPTYEVCSVDSRWFSLSAFKLWHDENYKEGYCLDKDIIIQGNTVYSPELCRYVPHRINTLFIDPGVLDSDWPRGVHANKPYGRRVRSTYRGQCNLGGKRVNATFKTPQEAHTWYHETKAEYVKQVASDALQAGEIQQDVYEALINRTYHEAEHARRCSAQLWAEPTPRIAAEQTLALAINTNDMATIDAQLEMLASSDWTEEELQQYSQEHGDA